MMNISRPLRQVDTNIACFGVDTPLKYQQTDRFYKSNTVTLADHLDNVILLSSDHI